LWSKYGGGVPHTVVLSPDGKVLGRISGGPKNPKDYLGKLRGILKGSAE
jgi:hypothetical protein